MKLGEFIATGFSTGHDHFLADDVGLNTPCICKDGLEEIFSIKLTQDPITLEAFDEPGEHRRKVTNLMPGKKFSSCVRYRDKKYPANPSALALLGVTECTDFWIKITQ